MTNYTFHNRHREVSLNQTVRGGEFWELLDEFAREAGFNRPYTETMYGSREVTVAFLERLPAFRKWMAKRKQTWFKTWEQREAWYDSDWAIDTPECNALLAK